MRAIWLGLLTCSLVACGGLPPTQEMSDARQALHAVREIGADTQFPGRYANANEHLREAEQGIVLRQHRFARHHALDAKNIAQEIHQLTDGLQRAEHALARAQTWQVAPLRGRARLAKARQLAREPSSRHAIDLAEALEKECFIAVNQIQLTTAREQIEAYLQRPLSPRQREWLWRVETAVGDQNGALAITQLNELRQALDEKPLPLADPR